MTLFPADPAFVDTLRAVLPEGTLSQAEARHLEEPRGIWRGQPCPLARPQSVLEVATILRHANAARVGVVPLGGGTGLVGGQVMPEGPVPLILSLERMNKLRAIHADENVAVVEAGMVLADVQQAAKSVDRLFPLSLAAEGTACIGGNLSTNAGGTGVLRYGNTRDLCLGIEAVLPDGQIFNGLTRLRKNNTGYDLRNLLIGAEGTLGVITAAALKLSAIPAQTGTALLQVSDPASALRLLSLARAQLGEMISGFELIHRQGLAFLREHLPDVRVPFDALPEWVVLIELGLSGGIVPQTALETLFEAGMEAGLVSDGLIAQNQQQSNAFWAIREMIPEANRLVGSISSHDISVPLSELPRFIAEAAPAVRASGDVRINCFGHVGDGNLHYNVFPALGKSRSDYKDVAADIKAAVHDLVHKLGGSISAEHGIGRGKVADLERYGDPVKLEMMRAIKTALDPNGIMNPGAVLRATP